VRHRNARKKMGRTSSHRTAMFNNMLTSLVEHGRITTTERKAKELRGIAERSVTRFTRLGDILTKDQSKLDDEERSRVVHAMRMVGRDVRQRRWLLHLYNEWAPRYLGRSGGYTRVLKMGPRKGDAAPMAMIEFIDAEMPEREGGEKKEEKKGLLGRKKDA
jgi:large subunit ribosomal protein L17